MLLRGNQSFSEGENYIIFIFASPHYHSALLVLFFLYTSYEVVICNDIVFCHFN